MTNLDQQFKEARDFLYTNKKNVRSKIEQWLGRDYEKNSMTTCEDCGAVIKKDDAMEYIDRTPSKPTNYGKVICCKNCYEGYMKQIAEAEAMVAAITPEEDKASSDGNLLYENERSPMVVPASYASLSTTSYIQMDTIGRRSELIPANQEAEDEVNKLKVELAAMKAKLASSEKNSKPKRSKQKKKAKRRIEL